MKRIMKYGIYFAIYFLFSIGAYVAEQYSWWCIHCIDWNGEKQDFDYSIYYFNDNDKDKDLGRSLWDITDLEVWQQLANLFDLNGHKWCKLVDGTICEYYECWKHYNTEDGKIKFKKYKHPIDRYYNFNTYIPEDNILEDNVEPNKE